MDYARYALAVSIFIATVSALYISNKAFNKIDEVKGMVTQVQEMQVSVKETAETLKGVFTDAKEKLPDLAKDTSKKFIDGIRDGFGDKKEDE